jgi:hypothetical protein
MAAINEKAIEAAIAAGKGVGPRALAALYFAEDRSIGVELDNGVKIRVPVRLIPGLGEATDDALAACELSPSGVGLYFPAIDEDVYIPGLYRVISDREYLARERARAMGAARSEAKAASSRENGRKGGRPRKSAAVAAPAGA